MSNKSGDCKAGRWPMQHKSQSLPMSSEWRCAGEAAAVLMASTAHAHASNRKAFHGRLWHMSYHDINKFGNLTQIQIQPRDRGWSETVHER